MIIVVVSSDSDCWDDGVQCVFVGDTLDVALSIMRCYDARYENYPRQVFHVRAELGVQVGMSLEIDEDNNHPRRYYNVIHPTSEYYLESNTK